MDKRYGHRFRVLHSGVRQGMTNALAQMGLTGPQGQIIGFVSNCPQPPCPHDIERVFQLSHPTVSGLLSRLEKKEFIRLEPDPADKRCKRIYLLERGKACSRLIKDTIAATEARIVRGFTPEEQAQFSALLDRAVANICEEEC